MASVRCKSIEAFSAYSLVPGERRAFIWDKGIGMLQLDSLLATPGITLEGSGGINNRGQIAATGYTNGGPRHAFLLTPIVSPKAINFSEPPHLSLTLPAGSLLPKPSLVYSASTPAFIESVNPSLPSKVRNWLDEVAISIGSKLDYPQWLKDSAEGAGTSIEAAALGVNLAVSGATKSVGKGLSFIGLWAMSKIAPDLGRSVDALEAAEHLAAVAVNAKKANPMAAGLLVNSFIWGNMLAPQLHRFAQDPPDANYTEFYQIPLAPPLFNLASTGNTSLDKTLVSLFLSSYYATLDLMGARHSFDRYTSAYNSGDTQSAFFQLEAILYYLTLYKAEATRNAEITNELITLLPPDSLTFPLDATSLAAIQDELSTNGFPSDLLPLFDDFGLSDHDLLQMKTLIYGLSEGDFAELSVERGLNLVFSSLSRTASVPKDDKDKDGVIGAADACVPTPAGQVVNAEGCSVADLCPCDNAWKNHGKYVSCVTHAGNNFVDLGLITGAEKGAIVSEAAKSQCGKKSK
ncbi:MAG: hypothetical protein L0H73_14145 [Nitrococcus sp.]|nr:hypothetical protein [Nitrococcus sp.]